MRANGRARVSARAPQAFAVCDRCSFRTNRVRMNWQYEWAGTSLQNLRILVCERCMDIPQPQLRTIILTPDPLPVRDPRPDQSNMETGYAGPLTDDFGNIIGDDSGNTITVSE